MIALSTGANKEILSPAKSAGCDLTVLDSKQYKETSEMLAKLAQLQPMFATAIQQGRKLRGRDYYFVTEQFGKYKAEQEIEAARERILGLKLKL